MGTLVILEERIAIIVYYNRYFCYFRFSDDAVQQELQVSDCMVNMAFYHTRHNFAKQSLILRFELEAI